MQEQPPILRREDRVHRERDWGIEYYNNISIYVISNAIRTPFQGDFLVRVDPRAEALGCFLCALRAIGTHTRKSPNYRARARTPVLQCPSATRTLPRRV